MTAMRGPVIDLDKIPSIHDVPQQERVSFRMVTSYFVGTDSYVTRLDVKRNGEQFHSAMSISLEQPAPGSRIGDPLAPLMLPTKGVEQCAGGVVDRATLRQALLDLAEVLA